MKKEEKEHFQLAEALRKEAVPEKKRRRILKNVRERIEKEKTMKLSVKEGAFASIMSGTGVSYLSLYALALKANNIYIGLLSSIPNLLSPLTQIFSSRFAEKYPRKKLIVLPVFLQAFTWIPILLLAVLFWKNIWLAYLPVLLILFYSLYAIFGAVASPAWFSLMGDIVPEKIRGKYFGKRNRIAELVALISFLSAGFILDLFQTKGLALIGFSLLFFVSFIARTISAGLFKKHYEPGLKFKDGYYFNLFQFAKKSVSNNFGRFVIYVALIHFATNIAGPFFAVYMIKELKFSYLTFTLVTITASIATIIFMPIWGKFADKYGNRELLRLGGFLVPFLPIAWLFGKSPVYIALVPQIIGGVGWAAFNLAASNFIYDSVSREKRALCVAYYNVFIGAGTFAGGLVGGFLAHYLTVNFMNKFLLIFLISGILRLLSSLIMLSKIKEVRKVEKSKNLAFSYLKEIVPSLGIVKGINHEIDYRFKKIKNGFRNFAKVTF